MKHDVFNTYNKRQCSEWRSPDDGNSKKYRLMYRQYNQNNAYDSKLSTKNLLQAVQR